MTDTATPKTLPNAITTLDLIKTFAVICMIIDHIGFYFFPDYGWFRAVGRLGGAPIWFFLVGYAASRHIPNRWLIGALILVVCDYFLFTKLLPFNVIITIIGARLLIDPVMNIVLKSRYLYWLSMILLALFYIPTNIAVEYGTLAILCAIVGYLVRHRDNLYKSSFLNKYDYWGSAVFMVVAITILQTSNFSFYFAQSLFLFICTAALTYVLMTLKVETFKLTANQLLNRFLQFCGRRTLDIYVAHLVAFKFIFLFLYAVGFYR